MLSLKHKSFSGVTWSFIDNIAGSGISFLVGIILARLLSPSVFGMVGMVTVFFAIANTFIDSGFSIALIRKMQCSQEDYNTVFYFNICISVFVYLILYFLAPYIAAFYRESGLTKIIRTLSCIIVIDSLSIVQKAILIKEINFKLQTKVSLVSTLLSGIVGITLAYKNFGVWSLVYQMLSKQIIAGVLFWLFSKWRPSAVFSWAALKEFFSFGSKLLGSGLIVTLSNNIYYFVIGKFFSSTGLGYYTRAEQFNAIVTNNITSSLERVFFPVLSSIQEQAERFKMTLKKVLATAFFITYYPLLMLAAIAKPLIIFLIGAKWTQSVIYLQLLCIGSIFYPFNVINLNVLKIFGRSDLILRLQIIKTFLTLIIVLSAIYFGITVMLTVRILTTLIATIINGYYTQRLAGYSLKSQFKDISGYFTSITLLAVPVYALNFFDISNALVTLIIQAAAGFILFILLMERQMFEEYAEIRSLLLTRLLGFAQLNKAHSKTD